MRLLVVEDNARLASLIANLLQDHGFAVDSVENVEAALADLETTSYDLILLDLSLPDGDGVDILKRIRRRGQATPVLVATARADVTQRVQTLNQGADDYLVKPFSLEELLARVRALLRRPPQLAQTVLTAGNVALGSASLTLTVGGIPLEMPRRELGVLATLLRHDGRLVTKQQLTDSIYSFDDEVTPNAIEAAVSRLRRRLEAHRATVSVTAMRGLGYIVVPTDATEAAI
jgi:DNA-binding response OmpR family regulator